MKFLLIDSNASHRELLETNLRRVYPAANFVHITGPEEFEGAIAAAAIDVALIEYRLEWTGGLQVLRRLKASAPDALIVMVTDCGSEQVAVEGFKSGLADYVLKRDLHRLPAVVQEGLARRRLRRAHEDAIERFRIICELSSDYAYSFRIEPDGTFVREWITDAFTRITGYGAADLHSGVLLPLAHPEDKQIVAHGRELLRRGEPYSCELRILTRSGETRWLRDSARPVWDEAHSRVVRVIGAGQDITDRKQAEEHREQLIREQAARAAAEAGEHRYRSLAEAIPQIVFTLNADGRTDYLNRQWFEYTGLSPERSGSSGVVHPDDLAANQEAFERSLATGDTFTAEYRIRRASDGAWRWHLARAMALRDDSGKVVKWFGTSTDIDDQKRSQESLREAQKLESIGLLAGGIAHDFNNLLTRIMGNISLALEELPPEDSVRVYLEHSMLAGERAADLTRQLLAYSGKGRFFVQAVNVSGVVRDITTLLTTSIPKKVELDLQLDPNLPPVEADATQIQQLVMNMVINGAEAIGDERPGCLRVATGVMEPDARQLHECGLSQPGPYVCIEVTDTGCGMDDYVKAHMFDPFFTTKFTGRGLGMSAALGIVRGHNGAIQVESHVGEGSRIRILLPAAAATAEVQPADDCTHDELYGTGTVLVVDDEEAVRDTAAAVLERYGYDVLLAKTGRDAIECVRTAPESITLVLLDMTMPVMDGAEALAAIKRLRPDVPVLASSGYSESVALERFHGHELAGFIQKPYTAGELARKIHQVRAAAKSRALTA